MQATAWACLYRNTVIGGFRTIWSVTCAPCDNEHLETDPTPMKHFKFQGVAPHITHKVRVILKSQIIPNIYENTSHQQEVCSQFIFTILHVSPTSLQHKGKT